MNAKYRISFIRKAERSSILETIVNVEYINEIGDIESRIEGAFYQCFRRSKYEFIRAVKLLAPFLSGDGVSEILLKAGS